MMRSGRTTRMIQRALSLKAIGKDVYILAHSSNAKEIKKQIPDKSGIKVQTYSCSSGFSWEHMRMHGTSENCVVLVDHFLIESKFKLMLDELHRYDQFNPLEKIEKLERTIDDLENRLSEVEIDDI